MLRVICKEDTSKYDIKYIYLKKSKKNIDRIEQRIEKSSKSMFGGNLDSVPPVRKSKQKEANGLNKNSDKAPETLIKIE